MVEVRERGAVSASISTMLGRSVVVLEGDQTVNSKEDARESLRSRCCAEAD